MGWRWDDATLEEYLGDPYENEHLMKMIDHEDSDFQIVRGLGSNNYVGMVVAKESATGGDDPIEINVSKMIDDWRLLRLRFAKALNLDPSVLPEVRTFLVPIW